MNYVELLNRLRAALPERDELTSHSPRNVGGMDLDDFLADSSIPAALLRSKALDCSFILARDRSALAALTQADEGVPVLYFDEIQKLDGCGLEELACILELKRTFGPTVQLEMREVLAQ